MGRWWGLPLPPEIVLELFDYLEPSDVVAVAQAAEGFAELAVSAYSSSFREHGRTILFSAVTCGHVSIVQHYLEKGADPCASDDEGNTPLHWAAAYGHCNVTSLLIDVGAI